MKDRLRAWLWREQSIVVLLGTHAGSVAVALTWEAIQGDPRYRGTAAWAILFFAAWVLSMGYHARPHSRRWWTWSGSALVGAYVSRAALLVTSSWANERWLPEVAIGAATWVTVAALTALLWLRFITPGRADQ